MLDELRLAERGERDLLLVDERAVDPRAVAVRQNLREDVQRIGVRVAVVRDVVRRRPRPAAASFGDGEPSPRPCAPAPSGCRAAPAFPRGTRAEVLLDERLRLLACRSRRRAPASRCSARSRCSWNARTSAIDAASRSSMLPIVWCLYGCVVNALSKMISGRRPNGWFSKRIRRSSLTTSRSVLNFSSLTSSDAMRSASSQSTSGRYCAGTVCQ